jgi:hypothetical protein
MKTPWWFTVTRVRRDSDGIVVNIRVRPWFLWLLKVLHAFPPTRPLVLAWLRRNRG